VTTIEYHLLNVLWSKSGWGVILEIGFNERGSATLILNSSLGGHSRCGEHGPWGTSHFHVGFTEIVAGRTAAHCNFLTFHNFRIIPTLLWRETPSQVRQGESQRGSFNSKVLRGDSRIFSKVSCLLG